MNHILQMKTMSKKKGWIWSKWNPRQLFCSLIINDPSQQHHNQNDPEQDSKHSFFEKENLKKRISKRINFKKREEKKTRKEGVFCFMNSSIFYSFPPHSFFSLQWKFCSWRLNQHVSQRKENSLLFFSFSFLLFSSSFLLFSLFQNLIEWPFIFLFCLRFFFESNSTQLIELISHHATGSRRNLWGLWIGLFNSCTLVVGQRLFRRILENLVVFANHSLLVVLVGSLENWLCHWRGKYSSLFPKRNLDWNCFKQEKWKCLARSDHRSECSKKNEIFFLCWSDSNRSEKVWKPVLLGVELLFRSYDQHHFFWFSDCPKTFPDSPTPRRRWIQIIFRELREWWWWFVAIWFQWKESRKGRCHFICGTLSCCYCQGAINASSQSRDCHAIEY